MILIVGFAILFSMIFILSLILWVKVNYGDGILNKFIMITLLTAFSMLSGSAAFALIDILIKNQI